MGYIGNIVTDSKIEITSLFNVTRDYKCIDKNIPTLIVGWEKVKELYPNQDILDNRINDDLYWTFSKREKRYQYEKDLNNFINNVIKGIEKNVNYHFFNYLLAVEDKRDSFINYIQNSESSIYYNSKFLYIYNPDDLITIGVSLKDVKYVGINIKFFIEKLTSGNKIISNNINDIGEDAFFIVKDNVKFVPYLNYLKNKDIYNKIF
jgi:hypothetical protein